MEARTFTEPTRSQLSEGPLLNRKLAASNGLGPPPSPAYRISPIYLVLTRAILFLSHQASKEPTMEWTAPKHEEIDLNCEISSYANAEL